MRVRVRVRVSWVGWVVGRAPAFRALVIVLLRVGGVLEEAQALARPVLEPVDGGEELAHVGELLLVEVAVVQHVPPLHLVRVRVRFRVRVRVRVRVTTSWWPSAAAYLEEMWRRYAGDMGEMWGGHVVVANKVGQ